MQLINDAFLDACELLDVFTRWFVKMCCSGNHHYWNFILHALIGNYFIVVTIVDKLNAPSIRFSPGTYFLLNVTSTINSGFFT